MRLEPGLRSGRVKQARQEAPDNPRHHEQTVMD